MLSEQEEFDQFIERMSQIRDLSSPPIYDVDNENEYSKRLRENFQTIGKLASKNRKMLDEVLYPLLEPEKRLTEEVAEQMNVFSQKLLSIASDFTGYENLDLPIMTMVGEKLVSSAFEDGTIEDQINRMDSAIISNYSMMNMTERITANTAISQKFKDRGLQIGEFFLNLIKKENLKKIKDEELRELILTNARFTTAFYERASSEEENEHNLNMLDELLKIPEDPFYQQAIPNCNWKYYKIRTLGYYLQCTDMGNIRGFTKEQIERIAKAADEAEKLIATDPEYFNNLNGGKTFSFLCARNRYLIGKISEEEYLKILLDIYEHREKENIGPDGDFSNVLIPLEIILFINSKKRPSAEDCLLIKKIYNNISGYMFRMPNAGGLTFVMEFFAEVVNNFVEIPGCITFEDFGLQSLAALHPPTYIHSNMVGQISVCLCAYLIDLKPELFVGLKGYKNVDEVIENREKILYFTYHAAICHDFGKIPIIDTIFVYGRRLLDDEFGIIKTHPIMGYNMLKKYPSTCDFAEVALGHHRFYDDSKGYPESFKTKESEYKTIIDIVLCADCMDAATDSVGRSYNQGKTIEEYIAEVREGSGTRYAPWLSELFENEDLKKDIRFILTTGREQTYRDTFILLKNVKEKEN